MEISTTQLFELQRSWFRSNGKKASLDTRRNHLLALRKWILAHEDDILDALHQDFRKHPVEAGLTELKPVLTEINHAISHLSSWAAPRHAPAPLYMLGTRSKILREPKGNVLIISPWNFPFMLAGSPLASALAAGCTVTLKPSEMTPHTAALIARMVKEVFPMEQVHVVNGGADVAGELLKQPWDHIFFTGSPQVGKIVMRAAAENLSGITLELGGANPCFVTEHANLRDAARKIIFGKFFNCGQSCVSPNAVYVHASVSDAFLRELLAVRTAMYGEEKDIPSSPDYARIVNDHHYRRVSAILQAMKAAGGTCAAGGTEIPEDRFISPAVISGLPADDPLLQEEIFGPVLPIVPYQNSETVADITGKGPVPLAMYVFSSRKKDIDFFMERVRSGTTGVNETTIQFAHPELPFGGHGWSGIGSAHGESGFMAFTLERSVLRQRKGFTMLRLFFPPYRVWQRRLLRFVLRWL